MKAEAGGSGLRIWGREWRLIGLGRIYEEFETLDFCL
jgi:hypothetical protein